MYFEELKDEIHSAKVRCAYLENEISAMMSSPGRNEKYSQQPRHKANHIPSQPMIFVVGDPLAESHPIVQQYEYPQ